VTAHKPSRKKSERREQGQRPKRARAQKEPAFVRPGEITDGDLARGEVRSLRIDVALLAEIVTKDLKAAILEVREGQREINVELMRALRSLTSFATRLDEHERRFKRLENGAGTHEPPRPTGDVDVDFDVETDPAVVISKTAASSSE
jgi:hypothetical protein